MITIDKKTCSGCEMCVNICPKQCISMSEDEYGFRYPIIDTALCINCNLCEKYCPVIDYQPIEFKPTIYAAQNKNEEIRLKSSSGGIFSVFAETVLNLDGYVYGARWNDLKVEHCEICNIDELDSLRGSKYLQSNIGMIYKEVEKRLKDNKKVLFTGTGCQIAGLKSYLRKEYDFLYTVEIVCHGIPSNTVFKKYVSEMEEIQKTKLIDINFRDKISGWNTYSISTKFESGNIESCIFNQNSFMKGYIQNMYLRPSCTSCKFKQMKSGSDILLGDFWGVNELGSPWNDNKGTSVVFINSSKGEELFQLSSTYINFTDVNLEFATQFNPCIVRPVDNYQNIYDDLSELSLQEAVNKNTVVVKKPSKIVGLKNRIINKIKRCYSEKQ